MKRKSSTSKRKPNQQRQHTVLEYEETRVTERRSEEVLRHQTELMRAVFNSAGEAIFILDAQKPPRILDCNQAASNIFGYPKQEMLGKTTAFLHVSEKSLTQFQSVLYPATEHGRPFQIQDFKMRRRDGSVFPSEHSVSQLLNDEGERIGWVSLVRDITERKRLEEDTRDLALFPSENPNPILRLDSRGTVLSANEACTALLRNWNSRIGQVAPKFWCDAVTDSLSSGENRNIDIEFGGRSYAFLVKPIIERHYVNFYGRDITDRKRAADALQESQQKLRRFSQFLGAVIENANVWLNVLDKENKVLVWNKAAEVISGYSREEVLGQDTIWSRLYPDEVYRKQITDSVIQLLEEEKAEENVETNIRCKDGQTRTISWNERPLLDEHGMVIGSVAIGLDVTERKEMEEYLKLQINRMPIGLITWTPEFRVESWNPAAEQIFGFTAEEAVGKHLYDLIVPQQAQAQVEDVWRRLLEGDMTAHSVNENITKAGRTIICQWSNTPLRKADGTTIGVLSMVQDITERKRMEDELSRYSTSLEQIVAERTEKLAESERAVRSAKERLEYVIESNPAVTYLAKPLPDLSDYYATYKSKNVVSLTGFESEEFMGEKGAAFWASRVHPDDIARYRAGTPEFWKEGHRTCEYRFLHKNGTYRWIREEARVIRDPKGNVHDIIGYWTDVTNRKQMEEELRESRDQLEHVLAVNPAVLYLEEPLPDFSDTYSTFVSESARVVLGFEPEKFLGESGLSFWRSRIQPDDLVRYSAELPSLWKDGQHTFEYRFLHSDGTYRWITEQYRAVRDAEDRISYAVAVAIDITERKELEEKLARTERLALIGETAAKVGHDLRNPLQGMTGALYMLRKPSLPEKEKDEMLQLIQDSVHYSDAIVRDLTEYSTDIHLEPMETTPKAIIGAALPIVRVPENVILQDLSQERPLITVDRERMMRVIVNIIQNAIEAMPQGGTLTICSKQSDRMVEIVLSDTGSGMPEEIVQNLWKPFQTTKAKGLGLGLAICKRIVGAHGGVISVDSKAGAGTTVRIGLPIRPQAKEK